ncbi:MAG TPA: Hint domain-containing protein [Gemmatirosa sp.]
MKPIGDVRCGDVVRARDKSGALVDRSVVQTHAHGARPLMRIQLADGAVIRATPAHRFWTERHGFVAAHELQPGMKLHSADSTREVAVHEVGETSADAEGVCNLSIASDHTYFVGESRVLVHNVKIAGPLDV